MADNTWIMENESRVFSIIQAKTKSKVVALFPKARYTTTDENINSNTIFPTIYISEMQGGSELGSDLEGKTVNGILTTFQVRVSTNTNKNDAKKIMGYVLSAFKELMFEIATPPNTTSNDGIYQCVARFRRPIGASDKL